jgi:hypothetical protein
MMLAMRTAQQMTRIPKRRWGSRVKHRIFRAFVAAGGADLTTTQLIAWVFPRLPRWDPVYYRRVKAGAAFFADPVGRATTKGRPWLWRLRKPVE